MNTPDLPGTAPLVVQDDEEDRQPTNVVAELLDLAPGYTKYHAF